MLSEKEDMRRLNWLDKLITKYNLDLSGLSVFCEYADGNYLFTGIAAAYARAKTVYFYYPSLTDQWCMDVNKDVANFPDLKNVVVTNSRLWMAECDIITNSGLIRPIMAVDVLRMKDTAIIAFMMSKSQIRPSDIDIQACIDRGIELVETNEADCGILESMGFKLAKVLFEAGLSVWNDFYLLISTDEHSEYYESWLGRNGINYTKDCVVDLSTVDAIIVADHSQSNYCFVGEKGWIDFDKIKIENPLIKVINISGNIDVKGLRDNGIDVYPNKIVPAGHSVVHGDYLGYKVSLEFFVASLKAAELAARRRLTIRVNEEK
ncbi:MAG: hypothetical protein WCW14_05010 [Candidatus Paceibacterota bacterium]